MQRSGSGAKMMEKTASATSWLAVGTGSAPPSPSSHWAGRASRSAWARATSSSRAAGSTPVTRQPRRAAASAALPVPQPTSITWSPGSSSDVRARLTSARAAAVRS
jgi:hypothetical protein